MGNLSDGKTVRLSCAFVTYRKYVEMFAYQALDSLAGPASTGISAWTLYPQDSQDILLSLLP